MLKFEYFKSQKKYLVNSPASKSSKFCIHIKKLPEHLTNIIDLPKITLPVLVDLRNRMPPIYNQGQLGSCTANALCGGLGYINPKLVGSRLFLYYNERMIEGNTKNDTGAYIHDGVASLIQNGICPEVEWPYNVNNFAVKPPVKCYDDALLHKVFNSYNLNNDIVSMKTCLNLGYPFTVGIMIYNTFDTYTVSKTGMVPMPTPQDKLLGGHAVLCVGYNDIKQVFIMRNSWGSSWGDKGYFYLPYAYLTSTTLTSDLWCIKMMQ